MVFKMDKLSLLFAPYLLNGTSIISSTITRLFVKPEFGTIKNQKIKENKK